MVWIFIIDYLFDFTLKLDFWTKLIIQFSQMYLD